jgi:hypothetical protein
VINLLKHWANRCGVTTTQHVQRLRSGSAVLVLVRVTCGWSPWEQELVADLFRVAPCNTVRMVMQARLGTWLFKQTVLHVRVVNVVVGSGMHLALGSRSSLEESQEKK